MNLIEKLEDLYKQAKTERSHAYTASLLRETIDYLKAIERDKITGLKEYEILEAVRAIETECRAVRGSLNR